MSDSPDLVHKVKPLRFLARPHTRCSTVPAGPDGDEGCRAGAPGISVMIETDVPGGRQWACHVCLPRALEHGVW